MAEEVYLSAKGPAYVRLVDPHAPVREAEGVRQLRAFQESPHAGEPHVELTRIVEGSNDCLGLHICVRRMWVTKRSSRTR